MEKYSKRFERLEDGRIKIRKGHKRKPFLILRKVQEVQGGECFRCDLHYCCGKIGDGIPVCFRLVDLGMIESCFGVRFEKEEG